MRKQDIEAQKDRGWGQEVKERQVARPVGREGDATRDLRDERYRAQGRKPEHEIHEIARNRARVANKEPENI
jgi:hypothetical protein